MDHKRRAAAAAAKGKKPARYFPAVMGGYVAGLGTTIIVMNVFQAAQPALLYIVPGVLGATFLQALALGEEYVEEAQGAVLALVPVVYLLF